MKVFFPFLLLFFLFSNIYFSAYSQNKRTRIDSLLALSETSVSDSVKVRLYYQIALHYIYNHPDSCQLYGEKMLKIAEGNQNVYAKGLAYLIIGDAHFSRSELTMTLQYFLDAANLLEQVSPAPKELATVYAQLVSVYVELMDYKSGEEYAQKCIKLQKEDKNLRGLASIYNNTGDLYEKQKKYNDAAFYYTQALHLADSLHSPMSVAIANFNLGSVNRHQGNVASAFEYITKATSQSKALEDWEGVIYCYLEYGHLFFIKKDYKIALQYSDSALSLAREYENLKLERDAYQLKANVFETTTNIDSAYLYFKKAKALNDSIYNEFHQKLIHSLTTNQKINSLKQVALSNQQALNKQIKTTNILIIIGLILSGALLTLFLLHLQKNKHNELLHAKNMQIEQQKEKLEALNLSKDKILSVISHDLRAPINQIKSLLNLLHQNILSTEEFLELTKKLYNQVSSLSDNLENLLRWAYTQMSGTNVQKQLLPIKDYVQQIVDLYEASLAQKNIELKYDMPNELQIYMDKEHLKLALRNIVGNAIKFSHKDSTIYISSGEKLENIFISITDKGLGMTEEQLHNLFNTEKMMSNLGTSKESGAGIGLKLSKEFIEKNGGKLEVNSREGEGTTFTIFMPKML